MEKSELLKKVWPQWEIVRELGEGAFGSVYEVQRKDIGGTFKAALKFMSIPKSQKEIEDALTEGMDETTATSYFRSIMEDLVKEFATMEMLKGNTNIVSYEDHVVVEHENEIGWDILIRMELLTPFKDYLQSHSMDEKTVIKIGRDICSALVICEKRNIVHRDIKMENVFVSEYGDFKLGDFGVARTVEKTTSGMSIKGTISYMAPEVYKGQQYNSSVDMYSLGILLYRLVNNNRSPFLPPAPAPISYTDKENAEMRRLAGERFPDASLASPELMSIIRKATAYNATERYKSATEMRDDLARWALGKTPSAMEDDMKAAAAAPAAPVAATVASATTAAASTTAAAPTAAATTPVAPVPVQKVQPVQTAPQMNNGIQPVYVEKSGVYAQPQQAAVQPENSGVYVQPQRTAVQPENSGVYVQPQQAAVQPENSGVYVQPQRTAVQPENSGVYAQPQQTVVQPAATANTEKKKPKKGLIIGLIVGIVGLLVIVGAAFAGIAIYNENNNNNYVAHHNNHDDDDDDDDDDPIVEPEPDPEPEPEPEPEPDPEPVPDPDTQVADAKYHASLSFATVYGEEKAAFTDTYTYYDSNFVLQEGEAYAYDSEINEDGRYTVSAYGLQLSVDCFATFFIETDIPVNEDIEFRLESLRINGNDVEFGQTWFFSDAEYLCIRLEDIFDFEEGDGAYDYFGMDYPNINCKYEEVTSIYVSFSVANIEP